MTIVRELLRCGADVTKQNGAKRSVLQLAKGRAVRQLIHGTWTTICDAVLFKLTITVTVSALIISMTRSSAVVSVDTQKLALAMTLAGAPQICGDGLQRP